MNGKFKLGKKLRWCAPYQLYVCVSNVDWIDFAPWSCWYLKRQVHRLLYQKSIHHIGLNQIKRDFFISATDFPYTHSLHRPNNWRQSVWKASRKFFSLRTHTFFLGSLLKRKSPYHLFCLWWVRFYFLFCTITWENRKDCKL